MEISLNQPLGFSQLGNRTNNEDALFPDPQTTSPRQHWFLVCDGVGGAERGEVASQLAVAQFDAYFREHPVALVTEAYIQQALAFVQDHFDAYVAAHPQAANMGTTLTLLYRHGAGVTVAHVGDSRVYLIRQGLIRWRTEDHSYVNELMKAGVLSPDEARKHPQRNVITRAIQGGQKQRVEADVQLLNDLRAGDYFFMCSDGILERISEELLEKTLGSYDSNDEKLRTLLACCQGHTRDNFTAYLLQIDRVTGQVDPALRVKTPPYIRYEPDEVDDSVTLIGIPHPEATPTKASNGHSSPPLPIPENRPPAAKPAPVPMPPVRRKSSLGPYTLGVLLVLVLAVGGFAFWYWSTHADRGPTRAAAPATNAPEASGPTPSESSAEATPAGQSGPRSDEYLLSDPDALNVKSKKPELGLEVVERARDGKQGLRRIGGDLIFRPQFDHVDLDRMKWGLIFVKMAGKPKWITPYGKEYDEVGKDSPACERVPVRRGKYWGYLNREGREPISPKKYVKALAFDETHNCTAEVTEAGGKPYRIDPEGNRQPPAGAANLTKTES